MPCLFTTSSILDIYFSFYHILIPFCISNVRERSICLKCTAPVVDICLKCGGCNCWIHQRCSNLTGLQYNNKLPKSMRPRSFYSCKPPSAFVLKQTPFTPNPKYTAMCDDLTTFSMTGILKSHLDMLRLDMDVVPLTVTVSSVILDRL